MANDIGVKSHIMGLTLEAADISATPSIYSSEKCLVESAVKRKEKACEGVRF